jgi:hypothetical protein
VTSWISTFQVLVERAFPVLGVADRERITLIAVFTSSVSAQAIAFHDREIVPFESFETACNGEEVVLSGQLLLISQTTIDSHGGFHLQSTLVPNRVRGVGSVTGIQYKVVGGDWSHFNADSDAAPLTFTHTDTFNLMNQGGSDNLQFKVTSHITDNANGETTTEFGHFSATCVG